MAEAVIQVEGLRKSYGDVEAVAGIDLQVNEGEVFALLGPNGAGKTTTVEILEGYRTRDAGRVSVLGYDPARGERGLKQRIGIVLQTSGVEPYLTVGETLDLFRGYFPHPRPADEVLEATGLTELRDTRVRKLSGGQQRRLEVAIGLAGDPELLFLDEPTTGFDPSARRTAWDMVNNLKSLGKTVLLTTHYMDEAEHLADRVAIIARGKIVSEGTLYQLVQTDPTSTIRFRIDDHARANPDGPPEEFVNENGFYAARTMSPTKTLHNLTTWASERGIELEQLTVSRPSLEDVYLKLVGQTDSVEDVVE